MRNPSNFLIRMSVMLSLVACQAAPSPAETVLQGAVCSQRVQELTSKVEWYKSLEEAEQAAQTQGKLIFWVHMLGKIDGAT